MAHAGILMLKLLGFLRETQAVAQHPHAVYARYQAAIAADFRFHFYF
jgi:hypothetical protein